MEARRADLCPSGIELLVGFTHGDANGHTLSDAKCLTRVGFELWQ